MVIFGSLFTYSNEQGNPNQLKIDLTGVNIYVIMPNCKDINQPSCATLQEYWTSELKHYHAGEPIYWNGIRVEENLIKAIRR